MNKIIMVLLLVALGVYFDLFSVEQVLSFAGKVFDGAVGLVKSTVVFFQSGEATETAQSLFASVKKGF